MIKKQEEKESKGQKRLLRLLKLYFSFFRITALVAGGGLAMLPMIEETFVRRHKLMTADELVDMCTLTQSLPGLVAMNSAIYVGMKVAGFPGVLAAVAGAFTPPFFVIVAIAALFPQLDPQNKMLLGAFSGVRACVAGLILVTAIRMFRRTVKSKLEGGPVICYFLLAMCGVPPALLIVSSIPLGWFYLWKQTRRMEEAESATGEGEEKISR